MRTRRDLRTDDGRVGMEQVRKELFQRVAADIVVSVARGGREVARRHLVALQGV